MEKKRVLMAMSGGIDSTVAAMLLLEQGYELQRRFSVRSETYGSGTGIRTPYSGYPARI